MTILMANDVITTWRLKSNNKVFDLNAYIDDNIKHSSITGISY